MDREEFQQLVFAEPHLAEPIRRAASAGQPTQFGLITEAAVVALMFPLVRYVLVHVGLPWLHAAKRWSDLYLTKVHGWIDERYREEGLDPDAAEAAADALCDELQSITEAEAQAAWERLAEMIRARDGPARDDLPRLRVRSSCLTSPAQAEC